MFSDLVIQMLRQTADDLRMDADVFAEALSIVRGAQKSLERLAQKTEEMRNGDDSLIDAEEDCEETDENREEEPSSSAVRAEDTVAPPGIDTIESYSQVETALRESELTKQDPLMDKVRAFAQANGGQIKPGEASRLFCKLGLSKADPRNLAGYMTKEMRKTREFERVGQERSGLYRWLLFDRDAIEEVSGPILHEGNGLVELPVAEEIPV